MDNVKTVPAKTVQAPVRLEVQLVHPDAKIPTKKRDTDAGYDIYSVHDALLTPGGATLIHTGIKIAAPPGWYYTIEGRSSLWRIGVIPNRGIIDSTYCGEMVVSLVNFGEPYRVEKGERIAQLILHRQYNADFVEVDEFGPLYNQRGENGFGSTGKK